jgi:carboxymethylenebutenolidase
MNEDMASYGFPMWARAGREISSAYAQMGSPLQTLASLEPPVPVLHLYSQPDDPGYLAAQESFAAEHPWFSVHRLSAHSHFPIIEVPDELTTAIVRFVKHQEEGDHVREPALRSDEQKLNDLWNEHLRAEFSAHCADETIATIGSEPARQPGASDDPRRGQGRAVRVLRQIFLAQIPPDMEMILVSRTIGQGRLVDEMVARFTHTITMDFMLPGIPPTGKRIEVALVVVVQFDGDKLVHEHLYWDQSTVLVQLRLLRPGGLPVVGQRARDRYLIGAYG